MTKSQFFVALCPSVDRVRALVGYATADRQIQKDKFMFKRASSGDERKFTTICGMD